MSTNNFRGLGTYLAEGMAGGGGVPPLAKMIRSVIPPSSSYKRVLDMIDDRLFIYSAYDEDSRSLKNFGG